MDIFKKLRVLGFSLLVGYTAVMAAVGFFMPHGQLRYFMTDIECAHTEFAAVPLYAVNTTLSVFLLWAGAVLFAMSWRCLRLKELGGKEEVFLVSQALIFFYLGCDDRFLIHEALSETIGMKDVLFFGFLGMLELFFLVYFGRILERSRRVQIDVFLAGFFFGIMFMTDVFVSYTFSMHLALEDLAKLWSAVFLFKFSWDTCAEKIWMLKGQGQ